MRASTAAAAVLLAFLAASARAQEPGPQTVAKARAACAAPPAGGRTMPAWFESGRAEVCGTLNLLHQAAEDGSATLDPRVKYEKFQRKLYTLADEIVKGRLAAVDEELEFCRSRAGKRASSGWPELDERRRDLRESCRSLADHKAAVARAGDVGRSAFGTMLLGEALIQAQNVGLDELFVRSMEMAQDVAKRGEKGKPEDDATQAEFLQVSTGMRTALLSDRDANDGASHTLEALTEAGSDWPFAMLFKVTRSSAAGLGTMMYRVAPIGVLQLSWRIEARRGPDGRLIDGPDVVRLLDSNDPETMRAFELVFDRWLDLSTAFSAARSREERRLGKNRER